MALSLTTITIIAASTGGALVLVASILIAWLIWRNFKGHRSRHAQGRRASTGERWGINGILRDQSLTERSSPGKLYRKPSQAVSQHPRDSWLREGLLPSRQNSPKPSSWAVENGSYVPRPHRLKKSKSSMYRDSVLVANLRNQGARPALSKTNSEVTYGDGSPDRTYTTRIRKAQFMTSNGKAHIMSIIDTPEHRSHHGDIRDAKLDTSQRSRWAGIRRSIISSIKSRSPSKSPRKSRSAATPGSGSTQSRNRRSMSAPYVPISQVPARAVPAIPTPSNVPQLLNVKKTRQLDNSPSKESYMSHTTIGSSIFDGLSPNLSQDLRDIQAGIQRPGLKRNLRRRSSAPNLCTRSLLWPDPSETDKPERKPSAASSQLLPSPAKPIMRGTGKFIDRNNISKPTLNEMAEINAPRASPARPKVRARDTPITLSGNSTDWDVFGCGDQLVSPTTSIFKERQPEVAQVKPQGQTISNSSAQTTSMPVRKPRVLQKKWTKQEIPVPLTCASIAYSSTAPLNTPVMLHAELPQPSSVYSDPIVQSQDQNLKTAVAKRSVTSPHSTSQWSSSSALFESDSRGQLQASSPYLRQAPFGPRRMPSITSQMPSQAMILLDHALMERPQSRRAHHPGTLLYKSQTIAQNRKSGTIPLRYQFEEPSSGDEDEIESPVLVHPSHEPDQSSDVVPPPVQLDPTPLRQSFYGYEAVPIYLPKGARKPYTTNKPTGNEVKEELPPNLPRMVSVRNSSAPRPPSNLSNSFRLSAYLMASSEADRNSCRSSLAFSSSPPENASKNQRPASFQSATASIRLKDDRRPISIISVTLQSDQASSASVTPLKDYSELCELFPKPLSVSSDPRSPTWVTTHAKESTVASDSTLPMCPGSPKTAPRGLPPHPKYYLEQRNSLASNDSTKNKYIPRPTDKINKPLLSTTGKHSPLRRSIVHASGIPNQTPTVAPRLPIIPTPQAGTPLTLQVVNSLRQTDSAYRDLANKGLLRHDFVPVDLKIGQPTAFTANQTATPSKTTPDRQRREMSPSPSPRRVAGGSGGSNRASRAQKLNAVYNTSNSRTMNPFGAIGDSRSKSINLPRVQGPANRNPTNPHLKQRMEDAKRRRILGQQALNQQSAGAKPRVSSGVGEKENLSEEHEDKENGERKERVVGLGIMIPKRKAEVGHDTTNPDEGLGTKRRRSSPLVPFLEDDVAASTTRIPSSRRVRFSDTSKISGGFRESSGSQGMFHAFSIREDRDDGYGRDAAKRMSGSPGRIWREEVF